MIKLSELQNNVKIMDENEIVYDVEEVKSDLEQWKNKDKKLYTTTEYHANINARDMLKTAIEYEYDNMYEDWDERILDDVTEEDIRKIQLVLDEILSRSKTQNIAYTQDKEIEVDYE